MSIYSEMANKPTDIHLNPVKILQKLEEVMSSDSIIVADGGDFVGTAAYITRCGVSFCHNRLPLCRGWNFIFVRTASRATPLYR